MDMSRKGMIGRRELFRVAASVGAAAVATASSGAHDSSRKSDRGKRKSQYQPNAPEVRTFYRVNSYPTK